MQLLQLQHEKACKIYKDAIKIEPNNDRLLTNAASVFVTAGKKKIGLKYYKKAWKISNQSNELYGYNYGITMMVDTNGRSNLKLKERGLLKENYFADIVIFNKDEVKDNATFEEPLQFAEGVNHVLVNGVPVLLNGEHTNKYSGRFVKGPGFSLN